MYGGEGNAFSKLVDRFVGRASCRCPDGARARRNCGGGLYLAILAGFLATIIGAIARNTIMVYGSGGGTQMPLVVIVFAAVASLGGSSAALELATHSHDLMSTSVWIGALAGLFSSILMAMLMITYQMNPVKKERSSKRR